MNFPINPSECPYHNIPKERLTLDDGTTVAITKSVLNGTPTLSAYSYPAAYNEFVNFPIHNCPFCGANLVAPHTYEFDEEQAPATNPFYGLTKEAAEFAMENHQKVYSQYSVDVLVTKLREAEERLAQYEDGR